MAGAVLIMAGGTGGHIFPGLAVADALQHQDVPVCWLGTPRGLENRLVPEAGLPLLHITVSGLRGRGLLGWLQAPFRILKAFMQARAILRRMAPRCVLSMGGYAAGPGGLAARWLGIPLIVHEQNRRPGLTNRWLARWAKTVCTGFAATFPSTRATVVTGNPVRAAIRELPPPRQRLAGRTGPLRLLVLGGSQGARFLNEKVPAMLALLPEDQRPEVLHQCGANGVQAAREAYAQHQVAARVEPFIDDMAAVYAWADIVVCRAGALTVSELMAVGMPAILVPFPHAVDDHQYANGEVLSEAEAAVLVRETQWDPTALSALFKRWHEQREELLRMAEAAHALDRGDAAAEVARICMEVGS